MDFREEKGFTLIETILVMVVFSFAIVAAVSIYTLGLERLTFMDIDSDVIADESRTVGWIRDDVMSYVVTGYRITEDNERLVIEVKKEIEDRDEGMMFAEESGKIEYENRPDGLYRVDGLGNDVGLRTLVSREKVTFEELEDREGVIKVDFDLGGSKFLRIK